MRWKGSSARRAVPDVGGTSSRRLLAALAAGPFGAAAIALALSSCAAPSEVDDFGGPSGFARLEGTVTTSSGEPASGMDLALTRCGSPIGGLAGTSASQSDGSYELLASLPPAGFPSGPDSIAVRCELMAGMDFATSGELDVYFFPAAAVPSIQRVDLVESSPAASSGGAR